jgi:Co/Zn/Cd efflux system component
MSREQAPIALLGLCGVIVVLSILRIVGGISTGSLAVLTVFLTSAIGLIVALIFALLAFVLAKQKGWLPKKAWEWIKKNETD